MTTLSTEQIVLSLKFTWLALPLELLVICMGKLAVCAYLATIHGPKHATLKRTFLWTIGSLQFLTGIITIVLIYIQCSPVAKLWNDSLIGSCRGRLRNEYFAYFQGSELKSPASLSNSRR